MRNPLLPSYHISHSVQIRPSPARASLLLQSAHTIISYSIHPHIHHEQRSHRIASYRINVEPQTALRFGTVQPKALNSLRFGRNASTSFLLHNHARLLCRIISYYAAYHTIPWSNTAYGVYTCYTNKQVIITGAQSPSHFELKGHSPPANAPRCAAAAASTSSVLTSFRHCVALFLGL